jgi:hypothetical protein
MKMPLYKGRDIIEWINENVVKTVATPVST